jgi:hypothetical protein
MDEQHENCGISSLSSLEWPSCVVWIGRAIRCPSWHMPPLDDVSSIARNEAVWKRIVWRRRRTRTRRTRRRRRDIPGRHTEWRGCSTQRDQRSGCERGRRFLQQLTNGRQSTRFVGVHCRRRRRSHFRFCFGEPTGMRGWWEWMGGGHWELER